MWSFSKSSKYSVKSAYFALKRSHIPFGNTNFSWICKILTYQKIQIFMWLIVLNKNLTKELLIMKGMNLPPICMKCQVGLDCIPHIFRECLVKLSL